MRPLGSLDHRVAEALANVDYPAERWEILAQVGAGHTDRLTAACLARLPAGTYSDLQAVLAAARRSAGRGGTLDDSLLVNHEQ